MESEYSLNSFHPAISEWFLQNIGTPSLPQALGWPKIQEGKNVLVCAPTGAGKTLAAFLESIDHLLKKGLEGALPEGVFILYVSPLKALNNDIYKNLDLPLEGIKKKCLSLNIPFPEIKKAVRTGDTPQNERQKMLKKPPHILITTPESLYLMLTSKKAVDMLKNVRYLIIDEIHTMLGTKRGVHLAVSVERLEHLTGHELIRIGLSATVNPVEAAACYLGGLRKTQDGYADRPVCIVAPTMERSKDLKIHMPVTDYRILEQGTIWPEIYDSILKLIKQHTSTIVFVNNRAVAEKVAANVNNMADEEICRPHHGSLSKNRRLEIEEKFKKGMLTCIVATSTLELGIDIGSVDLIVQVASPISVSSGLQRLGRAGHRLGATSKGRILPKTQGDLLKSAFMSSQMLEGLIEQEKIPENCLDILSQQIVSMSCEGKWTEEEMLSVFHCVWSYRNLKYSDFTKVLAMLSGDFEHLEDIPSKPRIYWDRQLKTIEGTGYSRMLAINSSGTIPDRGYFPVYLEDHKTRIGELDEVFVFESRLGDRFMLGNSAWKISKIEKNRVIVSPGNSMGARTPFWQGDGIGSPYEQGVAFGMYLRELSQKLGSEDFISSLTSTALLDDTAATNIQNFLVDQFEAIGCLSHDRRIVVEYFKDVTVDQKIIIHSHFGGRVNSVLAILIQKVLEDVMRCQVFTSSNNDTVLVDVYGCPDSISGILSLLNPNNVENTLISMLPSTSRFAMTFRYTAYRALMMGIRKLGKRLPLWVQRLRSVDTLENARKYLDHPLIIETMRECLDEIFDIPNTIQILKNIRDGKIEVVEKKTWFPSPFASDLLFDFKSFMMYMEKAPHPGDNKGPVVSGIDALSLSYRTNDVPISFSSQAISEVRFKNNVSSKLSQVSSLNELHSFLLIYGDITSEEVNSKKTQGFLDELLLQKRVLMAKGSDFLCSVYIAAEELSLYMSALGPALMSQLVNASCIEPDMDQWTEEEAIFRIVRRFSRYHSPFTLAEIKDRYSFALLKLAAAIAKLKSEELLVSGSFTSQERDELCHVKVYEAIIRMDSSLRAAEITANPSSVYAAFLPVWQRVGVDSTDPEEALYEVIRQLEGLYLPTEWWENIVFPARIRGYSPPQLDRLCSSGKVFWRISTDKTDKATAIAFFCVVNYAPSIETIPVPADSLNKKADIVLQVLQKKGACFTHALSALTGLQSSELLDILKTLVYQGLIVNDSFAPVRYFMEGTPSKSIDSERAIVQNARKIALTLSRVDMGRWEIVWPMPEDNLKGLIDRCFHRYGLLCKETLSGEEASISWAEVYEALKLREYAGDILRGYFLKGITGIQFMLPDAYSKMHPATELQVLNACDPAQVYGKIIPHSESPLTFTNIPGTVVVLNSGKPIVVFERFGQKISFLGGAPEVTDAVLAFKEAFVAKQVWRERKKVVVKYWPEDVEQKEILRSALKTAGFQNEIMNMVLWR